jgi:AbiJ-like protein
VHFPVELRYALLHVASRNGQSWTGKTLLSDFFGSIFDLKSLPSQDTRFQDAAGDMWQHTENNDDWSEEYVLSDERLILAR